MTERLSLSEAQERVHLALLAVPAGVRPVVAGQIAIDTWRDRDLHELAVDLARVSNIAALPSIGGALRAAAKAALAYRAHLDFEAGAKTERANAVALLRQQAAKFKHVVLNPINIGQRDRCEAKAVELETMALYIERGDRAEGH